MEFKRTTDIQVFQNTNQITLDDRCIAGDPKILFRDGYPFQKNLFKDGNK